MTTPSPTHPQTLVTQNRSHHLTCFVVGELPPFHTLELKTMRLRILILETCQKSDIEQECMPSLSSISGVDGGNEYLTSWRETHKTTGNNEQQVNIGDVALVHDASARVNWKLAVIESVNEGADGLIRSANIRTATRRTNRPIARLYPLEVTAATEVITKPTAKETPETQTDDHPVPLRRPVREAARRGKERIEE